MNRKEKRLINNAITASSDGFLGDSSKCSKYDKVADKVDNWKQVRKYIFMESLVDAEEDELEYFEDACTRYNHAVNNPKLSTGQKAGLLTGAAIVGFVLGFRSK